jgi:hypothetical protein
LEVSKRLSFSKNSAATKFVSSNLVQSISKSLFSIIHCILSFVQVWIFMLLYASIFNIVLSHISRCICVILEERIVFISSSLLSDNFNLEAISAKKSIFTGQSKKTRLSSDPSISLINHIILSLIFLISFSSLFFIFSRSPMKNSWSITILNQRSGFFLSENATQHSIFI